MITPKPASSDALTYVDLTWIEQSIEHWIRFGHEVGETLTDRRRRTLSFAPNTVFAFVRWASNRYGTIMSRIDIVRTIPPCEPYQTLPCVRPGGDILLTVEGWPKVEQVLHLIDAIEALRLDPVHAAPDYWRHVHNRMAAAQSPRHYTRAQHQAWLKRRRMAL